MAYFVIQLFANLAAFLGFTTWRCEHHNVQTTRAYDCDCENPNPTVAAIVGGAWEWMSGFRGWCAGDQGSFSRHWELIYGDEEARGRRARHATYILGISMGILTNIVLELVLVCRVHLWAACRAGRRRGP